MKQNIAAAIRLTLVCAAAFMGIYPLIIYGIAQAAPNGGKGERLMLNNKVVGYKLEGQKFTTDNYFNSRPSAVDYNAAGSAGSNKGPTNPDYLRTIEDRIDTFLVHNPTIKREQIPSELVTASGSGLDPDISLEGAYIQVDRIAKARHLSTQTINALIEQHINRNIFGPAVVHVLQLNIALDKLK